MAEKFRDGFGDLGHVSVALGSNCATVRIKGSRDLEASAAWIILDLDEAKRLARYLSVLLKGTDG